jgi:predicted phage terminase large subunit-like protein
MRRKGPDPYWGSVTEEETTAAYRLARKIYGVAKDAQGYYDFLSAVENFQNDQRVRGAECDYSAESRKCDWTPMMAELHRMNREMQGKIREDIKDGGAIAELFDAYTQSLLLEAPWDFEQYMLYCEIDRAPEERFYQPRMKTLRPVVHAMQSLEDNELDEIFLSMPPRVGKTTLMDFFVTWEIGKHPDGSCLYSSMSDGVTKQFYLGLLEVIRDPYTYHWDKVFPNSPVVKVNAADQTINCLRKTRYPSITCRSIDGTLNGACDCDNILIADDLCKGYEQAINKDVMAKLWARTQTDLLSRAKQGSKKLWIGTRWSLIDPIGCRIEMLKDEAKLAHIKWKEILLPALDEHDESNFNWKYGIGFDTQTFQGIRAGYERNNDMASWNAIYMQQPIEREGSLFASGDMRFYNGMLPKGEPARRFMAVDPAFGGSDFTAAPVCFQYDDTIYVVDVVYTDGDKRESIPALAKAVQKWEVGTMQIEANKMTEGYADELQAFMRENGIYCTVLTKPAPNNVSKEQRIFDRAPEIRESFVFLEHGQRPKHYQQFMDNVFSFTIMKRNKHDDAPDSLAMAASMVFRYQNNFVHTFRRAF